MKPAARRRARECAVQALYSWQLSHNDIADIEDQFLAEQDTSDVDVAYFRELYAGAATNAQELDKLMAPYSSRQLEALGHVERAVLRIALFELSKRQDVPYKVAINEAIELAKTFGAEESHKFINGMLDKVAPEVRPNIKQRGQVGVAGPTVTPLQHQHDFGQSMVCGEFNLIDRYFNRMRNTRRDVVVGIGDDCALLSAAEKKWIAVSTDTLVAGTHFLPDISPSDLGYKSLAVNLSDLAVVGADPAWLSLALTLPSVDEGWLAAFSDSLFQQLDYYDIQLIGGDTTRGPLSLTLTIHGLVPVGCALTRDGARIGDWIYVTGTLGDSAAGLAILQNRLQVREVQDRQYLLARHLRPQPRILQGQALRDIASAAVDVSDGIITDLRHILTRSDCGASINLDDIPTSAALLRHATPDQALRWALGGGEDYELCFTVPAINRGTLDIALGHTGTPFTCIGQIGPRSEGIRFMRHHQPVQYDWHGYDHFKTDYSE